jgi:hypothetical protein
MGPAQLKDLRGGNSSLSDLDDLFLLGSWWLLPVDNPRPTIEPDLP